MIGSLLRQTVTIQHRTATATDDHGNSTTSFSSTTVTKGYVEPREIGDLEVDDRQETSQLRHRLVLAAGTSIAAGDRVVMGTRTFEVDGEPRQAVRATTGAVHHLEVSLREVIR